MTQNVSFVLAHDIGLTDFASGSNKNVIYKI